MEAINFIMIILFIIIIYYTPMKYLAIILPILAFISQYIPDDDKSIENSFSKPKSAAIGFPILKLIKEITRFVLRFVYNFYDFTKNNQIIGFTILMTIITFVISPEIVALFAMLIQKYIFEIFLNSITISVSIIIAITILYYIYKSLKLK